jgi:hypothetical protein
MALPIRKVIPVAGIPASNKAQDNPDDNNQLFGVRRMVSSSLIPQAILFLP